MNKWAYKLEVLGKTIQTPVRMVGTIGFGCNNSGTAVFDLFNLSKSNRNQIVYQPGRMLIDDHPEFVKLYVAQDGQSFSEVFTGQILKAYSHSRGSDTSITTHIECNFCDFWWCRSSHTFSAGTKKRDAIDVIIKDMPNIEIGAIGNIEGNFLTDTTFDGTSFEQLQKISGGNCFIDNNKLYIVNANETVYTGIHKISSDTTLLNTPMYMDSGYYTIQSMFLPEMRSQQLIELESKIFTDYNGTYRVVGYTHNFVFDNTEGGQKTTDLALLREYDMTNQDIVTTTGTSKTNADTYQTLSNDNSKYKINGTERTEINSAIGTDVQSIYNYLQTHNGQLPQEKKYITKNISWQEMLNFHRNTNAQRKAECDKRILSNIATLAQRLQKFKDTYFNTATIKITCGWRSKTANSQTPNAVTGSLHVEGKAVDFYFSTPNVNAQWQKVLPYWDGGRGKYSTFIHVDLGSRARVWYD